MLARSLVLLTLVGCGTPDQGAEDGYHLSSAKFALEQEWRLTGDAGVDWQHPSNTTSQSVRVCDKAKLDITASLEGRLTFLLTRDFDWVTIFRKITLGGKVLLDAGRPDEVSSERLPYATTTLWLKDTYPIDKGVTLGGDLIFALDQMTPTGKGVSATEDRVVDEGKWRKLGPSSWKVTIVFPDEAGRVKHADLERTERELKELESRLSLNERTIADARKMKSEQGKAFVKIVDGLIAERDARKKLLEVPFALEPISIKIECLKP